MKSVLFGFLGYAFTSALLFGSPLHALFLLMFWRDKLGLAYWPALILVAVTIAIFTTILAARIGILRHYLAAVFASLSIGLSVFMIGTYAENRRDDITERFEPDEKIRASFYSSLRNAPREFQLFLHGAALKDCKPYAWSYRMMNFYELPSNVAANVLPVSWIRECNIRRTR